MKAKAGQSTIRKAIIYTRWSPRPEKDKDTCESTATQHDRLVAWCAATDMEVIGSYGDEDASGKTTNGRPGLQEAIRHACRTRAVLCVYSLSRLARNVKDAIAISEELAKHKADLSSIHERIDTTTAMGRFYFVISAALAALEREQIVERTKDAMHRHQKAGRRMGRRDRLPYGMRICKAAPVRMEEDYDEQQTIGRILELHKSGLNPRAICRQLDEEKYQRRGKTWEGAHRLVRDLIARHGK